jgi:hypothetical protein
VHNCRTLCSLTDLTIRYLVLQIYTSLWKFCGQSKQIAFSPNHIPPQAIQVHTLSLNIIVNAMQAVLIIIYGTLHRNGNRHAGTDRNKAQSKTDPNFNLDCWSIEYQRKVLFESNNVAGLIGRHTMKHWIQIMITTEIRTHSAEFTHPILTTCVFTACFRSLLIMSCIE